MSIIPRASLSAVLLGLLLAAAPAAAQAPAPETAPPADGTEAPETHLKRLGEPTWTDVAEMSLEEIDQQSAALKQERAARVKAIAGFEEQRRKLRDQYRPGLSDDKRKQLAYRSALLRYRTAEEQNIVNHINDRLQTLAAERVRRAGGTPPSEEPADDAMALDSVKRAHQAAETLRDYDEALAQILRREPLTEEDVVYALALLNEKAELANLLVEYFGALEKQVAAETGAAASASAATDAGGPEE